MKKAKVLPAVLSVMLIVMSISSCGVNKDNLNLKDYMTQADKFTFTNYINDKTEYNMSPNGKDAALMTDYAQVSESRYLRLYYNNSTAAIAVLDKRSGKVWFSNTPEIDNDDLIDSDSKNLFKSQLTIDYLDGQNFKVIDSYTSSVEKNTHTYEKSDNGLSVTYHFMDNKTDESQNQNQSQSQTQVNNKELFTVTLEYKIEDESLIAKIPLEKIKYSSSMPPLKISVLPHFGGSKSKENGYLFIPDGSGALVKFGSTKFTNKTYIGNVYGYDRTLEIKSQPPKVQPINMPVFGIKDADSGMLAIIEDGDAFSVINANRAGIYSSFNEVFAAFNTFSNQTISIGALENASKIIGIQDICYKGSLRIRYSFLKGTESDYSGMAGYYRNYLIKRDNMKPVSTKENIPFNLELVGAIDKIKSVLGIKYSGLETLTSTSQAETILKELKNNNILNINLKYTGWANGGMKQQFPSSINVENAIGGKNGLNKLQAYAVKNGVNLYPSIEFLTTPLKSSGFNKFTMTAKQVDQRDAKAYKYDSVTQNGKDYNCILSPSILKSLAENFNNSYKNLKIPNLCISDIGKEVFADYTKGKPLDRQTTSNIYKELLSKSFSGYEKIMLTGCATYLASYADVIIDVPFSDSNFDVADCSVPFYEIVYHGYTVYSSDPLNKSYDFKNDLLKTIEYGGSPYFSLMYADGSLVKNTDYSIYCSNNYAIWKNSIFEAYKTVNEALKKVQNAVIVSHSEPVPNVFKTSYSNNFSTYVNYNDKAVTIGNITIEGQGYKLVEEGAR